MKLTSELDTRCMRVGPVAHPAVLLPFSDCAGFL
jgi:hypothetical protein